MQNILFIVNDSTYRDVYKRQPIESALIVCNQAKLYIQGNKKWKTPVHPTSKAATLMKIY